MLIDIYFGEMKGDYPMTQAMNLVAQYDPNNVESFKVGAVNLGANLLAKRDTDDSLIIAGANENAELYFPFTAELVGRPVAAALCAAGSKFPVTASGAILKGAKLASAAGGKLATAGTGDRVIARAWNAALDGELVSAIFGTPETLSP